eukprot:CAMPEP_0185789294 /NCGR_PEP_ID=MMETSP1174-20130828/150257_1 /TAXON_ID=35687 /ORGANISM="Dictyocha speculum, Strain CCMP1381" /LENGTH=46 /DNA_ID= /DNA_START= /DNA_END= /DNA_ORIENTATION=
MGGHQEVRVQDSAEPKITLSNAEHHVIHRLERAAASESAGLGNNAR